ncbi:hypothetical protein B484DRAFT_397221 [Ochromonadaceae sp. CCMP2298]|nr:hypothetical protein B484DRAFT_397221 [Ochromonadaceae sp. CCMP2298]
MIHDFICCEEMPSDTTMTTESLGAPPGVALYGPLYLSLSPLHIRTGSVHLGCKASPSLLDVLTPTGGMLATTPAPKPRTLRAGAGAGAGAGTGSGTGTEAGSETGTGTGKGVGAGETEAARRRRLATVFRGALNVDLCLLTCGRCAAALGEAQLQCDVCDPDSSAPASTPAASIPASSSAGASALASAPTSASTSTTPVHPDPAVSSFALTDARDLRLSLQAVSVRLDRVGREGGTCDSGSSSSSSSISGTTSSSSGTSISSSINSINSSSLSNNSSISSSISITSSSSVEQVVARAVLQLHRVYGLSAFCLYVADADIE